MAEDTQGFVSLNPDDAVAGGFMSDVDADIVKARFEETTYGGRKDPSCALIVGYQKADDSEVREQIYSCGPLSKYTPSEDGTRLVPQGGQKGLSKQCNAYHFLLSLINAGWPKTGDRSLTVDISTIEGASVHLDEIVIARDFKDQADSKPKPIAVVSKINSFPWEASKQPAGGPGKAKGASKPTAKSTAGGKAPSAPAAASGEDAAAIDTFARTVVLEAVIAEKGAVGKAKLVQYGFKAKYGDGDGQVPAAKKPLVVQKLGADAFLNAVAAEGLWEYNGQQVTQDVEMAQTLLDGLRGE